MKIILLTLLVYILDILVHGSILGLILVIGYGIDELISDVDHNLLHMYLVGLAYYWLIDSIGAKFREEYRLAKTFKKDK